VKAHYLQHVPFEGLGSIEPWLETAGYEITATRLFDSMRLPGIDEFDLLIVMGGAMSVNDEGEYDWLAPEKQFIRHAITAGRAVLGICLGAQLIASSLGARVYPNRHKEIGWFPVQGVQCDDASRFHFSSSMDVFHWHGETFDLPPGAVQLARSKGCENQAFQIGRSVMGLQFHLETTPVSAGELVSHCGDACIASQYVQTKEAILSAPPEIYRSINHAMGRVLAFLQNNVPS